MLTALQELVHSQGEENVGRSTTGATSLYMGRILLRRGSGRRTTGDTANGAARAGGANGAIDDAAAGAGSGVDDAAGAAARKTYAGLTSLAQARSLPLLRPRSMR